jgi:hypothetical protein
MTNMRKLTMVLGCLWAGAAGAGVPELEPGVYLQGTSGPLTVNYFTAPSVIDWNNDGKKDLLVGQFDYGYVWLFLNQGTDAQPAFGARQQVRVGSSPITTSYG